MGRSFRKASNSCYPIYALPKSGKYVAVRFVSGKLSLNCIDIYEGVQFLAFVEFVGILYVLSQPGQGFSKSLEADINLIAITQSDDVLTGGFDSNAFEAIASEHAGSPYPVDT